MATLKRALITGAMLLATSTAMAATNADIDLIAPVAGEPPCVLVQPTDSICTLRIVDPDSAAALSSTGLASPAARVAVAPWWPLIPGRTGSDFKDAATEPGALMPATFERKTSKPPILALMALGAVVILLRRRPAGL